MAQQLRAFVSLPEDLGLVFNTNISYLTATFILNTRSLEILFWPPRTLDTCGGESGTQTHTCT